MHRKTTAWLVALAAAISSLALAPQASAEATLPCVPLLPDAVRAGTAIAQLGPNLPAVAALNGMTATRLTALAKDQTFWLDRCGRGFYVEEQVATIGSTPNGVPSVTAAFDLSQTFQLNSKPGSQRTIYLDFDGYNLNGTAWINYFKVTSSSTSPYIAAPYDIDGVPGSFNNTELANIQEVWRRVAEDYAAFDVNVTTAAPAAGVLERTDSSDQTYGATAVITNDAIQSKCSCGGIAYIGVFDTTGSSHETYQPALVFTRGLSGGTYPKYLAEAASHEVGHNLGLNHDGTSTAGYYTGGAGWAPIMGVGYYQPVSTWSKGEYPGANNTEDDYAVMAGHGLSARADAGNTAASATALPVGSVTDVISSPTDRDWYSIQPAANATYTATLTVPPNGPNLDAKLSLFASDGTTQIASNDPALSGSGDSVTGVGSSITVGLVGGQTYLLQVDGVGFATAYNSGTDYGSVGTYTLTLTSSVPVPLSVSAPALPRATLGTAYSAQFAAGGGLAPYRWSLASGSLPTGLTLDATSGLVSGVPTAEGTANFSVRVTDSLGATATTGALSITASSPVSVTTASLPTGSVNVAYSAALAATGGTGGYTWSIASGSLPATLTLSSSGTISGTPTVSGSYSVTYRATDSTGATATRTLTLSVVAPLTVSTTVLPGAKLGKMYTTSVSATGGSGTKSWSLVSGTLPPGITLSSSGTLSGKPTIRGTFTFTLSVTDSTGTVQKTFSLTVT